MAFDLASLNLGNLTSAIPSTNEIANQLLTGAAVSVVLAGAKSAAGQDALDPLHIFHQQTQATATVPAASTMVVGKTMPISAFNQLDAAGKAQVLAAGYSLVNG